MARRERARRRRPARTVARAIPPRSTASHADANADAADFAAGDRAAGAPPTAAAARPDTARLELTVFDGTRAPIDSEVELLVRILDGNQKPLHAGFHRGPSLAFVLPFHDNLADRYTVLVSADHHRQAGFTPVVIRGGESRALDLMLLPKPYRFAFRAWADLPRALSRVLGAGASAADAETRYATTMHDRPAALAAALSILTACSTIFLRRGTVLEALMEILWDESMAQDRFFGFATAELVALVQDAVRQGEFVPELNPGILHPGATSSFKQVQFGEANVQLTFHENTREIIGGVPCVKVEPDIDYFRDPLNHALLEVVPGLVTGQLTDPATVYVLRWIAGRFAGVPEFDPPFTIVSAPPAQ